MPALEMETGVFLGPLVSQSSLIGEFQISERPILKETDNVPENNTQGYPLSCTLMYIHCENSSMNKYLLHQHPCTKGHQAWPITLVLWEAGTGCSLGLHGHQSSSKFNERPCLLGIKRRVIAQSTQCLPLASMYDTCV